MYNRKKQNMEAIKIEDEKVKEMIKSLDYRRSEKFRNLFLDAVTQLVNNGYKPKAIWADMDYINFYIVTDDIDRSGFAKLIIRF